MSNNNPKKFFEKKFDKSFLINIISVENKKVGIFIWELKLCEICCIGFLVFQKPHNMLYTL